MDFVYTTFVFLHFIGFAALFGGAFTQLKGPKRIVNAAMFHGALTQLVTGVVLLLLLELGDGTANHMKLGIKFLVVVAITVLILRNRTRTHVANGGFWAILGLTATNAALAVFW